MGLRLYGIPSTPIPAPKANMPSATSKDTTTTHTPSSSTTTSYLSASSQQQPQQTTTRGERRQADEMVSVPASFSPLASHLAHFNGGAVRTVATGAGADTGAGVTRPKTEAEIEADRRYEEAMEEEYAKRDGGS